MDGLSFDIDNCYILLQLLTYRIDFLLACTNVWSSLTLHPWLRLHEFWVSYTMRTVHFSAIKSNLCHSMRKCVCWFILLHEATEQWIDAILHRIVYRPELLFIPEKFTFSWYKKIWNSRRISPVQSVSELKIFVHI